MIWAIIWTISLTFFQLPLLSIPTTLFNYHNPNNSNPKVHAKTVMDVENIHRSGTPAVISTEDWLREEWLILEITLLKQLLISINTPTWMSQIGIVLVVMSIYITRSTFGGHGRLNYMSMTWQQSVAWPNFRPSIYWQIFKGTKCMV